MTINEAIENMKSAVKELEELKNNCLLTTQLDKKITGIIMGINLSINILEKGNTINVKYVEVASNNFI